MRVLLHLILLVKFLHLLKERFLSLQIPYKQISRKYILFYCMFQVFLEADGRRTAAKANFLPEEVLAGGLSAYRRIDLLDLHGVGVRK